MKSYLNQTLVLQEREVHSVAKMIVFGSPLVESRRLLSRTQRNDCTNAFNFRNFWRKLGCLWAASQTQSIALSVGLLLVTIKLAASPYGDQARPLFSPLSNDLACISSSRFLHRQRRIGRVVGQRLLPVRMPCWWLLE